MFELGNNSGVSQDVSLMDVGVIPGIFLANSRPHTDGPSYEILV